LFIFDIKALEKSIDEKCATIRAMHQRFFLPSIVVSDAWYVKW